MLTKVFQAIALVPEEIWVLLAGFLLGAAAVGLINRRVTARRVAEGIDLFHEHIGDIVISVGVLGILAKSMVNLSGDVWVQAIPYLAWAILSAGVAMGANRAGLAYFENSRPGKPSPKETTQ